MIAVIEINKEQIDDIVGHCRADYPREACGILAGDIVEDRAVIKKVYRCANAEGSDVSYRLDPSEQFAVMKEIESLGLKIAAIYHSHPSSPAYPSRIDINRAFFPGVSEENFPGVVYLIAGLAGKEPEINAYLIGKTGIRRIAVVSV